MKKTKLTINTKVKYIDSPNYQKHFTLDDRIKIQKIIFEHRDDGGKLTIMLKDIGNMLSNDPSTISKEVKLLRIFKNHSEDKRFKKQIKYTFITAYIFNFFKKEKPRLSTWFQ